MIEIVVVLARLVMAFGIVAFTLGAARILQESQRWGQK